MELDLGSLGLTEIIRLQHRLSLELRARFERTVALGFSDIVDSSSYFHRFGDEAGRRQLQRQLDLLHAVLPGHQGRIVDTAGDGAFICFPTAEAAATAFVAFQEALVAENARLTPEHALATRMALHWGPVLTDGAVVTGDAVNLCARLAETARPAEIRLTESAFLELPNRLRLRCLRLAPVVLPGIGASVEALVLEWRDLDRFPQAVRVEETGEEIPLPAKETITFGRLRELHGVRANDVVLAPADPKLAGGISRWHFELRRDPTGLTLRSVSGQLTEVDGAPVLRGGQAPVRRGSVVRVAHLLTLRFLPAPAPAGADDTKSPRLS